MDHLMQGTVGLGKVSTVVLDEADRMLDMGFAPIIKRILDLTPENRQTLLFSATMPKEIEELALSHMRNPARVEIAPQGTASELVEQEVAYVTHDDKRDVLEKLLGDNNGPALVFTRTRHGARKLAVIVREMGHHAGELHSDRTLAQRQSAMEGFRTGYHRVLVATDIAARGIDVKAISLIVNWDVPEHAEDYVHRIGRTGRAGATGKAVTLVLREQAREVRDIEKLLGTEIPISDLSTVSAPVFHAPKQGGNRAAGNRGGAGPARRQRRPDRAPGARPAAANSFSDAVDRMPVREDSFPGRERPVIPAREQNREDRPYAPRAVDSPRSEGQQSWQNRANGPRPGYNRPEGNRPDGNRSYGDRSNDRPAYGDRQNQARPYGDRPAYGDRNQARPYSNDRSGSDRPYGNRPQNDRPYNDRPANDRPNNDQPYNDRSNGSDRPYNARPQENRGPSGYQGNRPYNQGGNQGGGYPGSSYKGNNYQSGGNQPYGRPNTDRPYNDRPNNDRPANDRPNYGRGSNDRSFGANQGDRPSFPRPEYAKPEFPQAEPGAPRPSTRVTGKPQGKSQGKPVQKAETAKPTGPRPDHDLGQASPKKSHRGWSGKPGKA
jgi:ATP-dependent RNA helicase RhlE